MWLAPWYLGIAMSTMTFNSRNFYAWVQSQCISQALCGTRYRIQIYTLMDKKWRTTAQTVVDNLNPNKLDNCQHLLAISNLLLAISNLLCASLFSVVWCISKDNENLTRTSSHNNIKLSQTGSFFGREDWETQTGLGPEWTEWRLHPLLLYWNWEGIQNT